MLLRPATFCLVLLLGAPASAAPSLEALRQATREGQAELNRVKVEQLARRSELSVLSKRIEGLKAKTKGRLLRGSELDASLKKSQELSTALTELARAAAARQAELEGASIALVDALSGELTRLRAEFDRQSERQARRAIIGRLRALRLERETARAGLPSAKLPALEALRPSDDPEELLEQADLLRDNQEKVAKELKGLEVRIAERHQEAELELRFRHFLDEEAMFDDQDRRLRVERRTIEATSSADPTANNTALPGDSRGLPTPVYQDVANGSHYGGASASASLDSSSTNQRSVGSSDSRPEVERARPLDLDRDDVGRLEQERTKLKTLAESLGREATALEARSAHLAHPVDAGQPVEPR